MKTGDLVKITTLIRSQKTGALLPREGKFVSEIENLGRTLILVDFGPAGEEYLFPDEIIAERSDVDRLRLLSATDAHASGIF